MSDTQVGQIITGDYHRDAIHVAIFPVVAAQILSPGEHVGFIDCDTIGRCSKTIGIVDPFLRDPVPAGVRFYLFLYPNTVTGMRHHWSHPAFDGQAEPPESDSHRERAESLIRRFAEECGVSYQGMIEIATDHNESGEYARQDSERYKDIDWGTWPDFWRAFSTITGIAVDDDESCPFTCSC